MDNDQHTFWFGRTYRTHATLGPLIALVPISFRKTDRHTPKYIEALSCFAHFVTPIGDLNKKIAEVESKVGQDLSAGLRV